MDQRQNRQRRDYVPPEMIRCVADSCGCGGNSPRSVNRRETTVSNRNSSSCGCLKYENNSPLAMVYSEAQKWCDIYDLEEAYAAGTIFKQLDFPFYETPCNNGRCGCRGGR